MEICQASIYAAELKFRKTFKHAASERNSSNSIFLKLCASDGTVGFGEALLRKYVTHETQASSFKLLQRTILPQLLSMKFECMDDVISFLQNCDGRAPPSWLNSSTPQISAWAAVDLALLDLAGKYFKQPILNEHSKIPSTLRYSAVVSADNTTQLLKSLIKIKLYGMQQVKLKIGSDFKKRIELAHLVLGRKAELRVDANMAWTSEDAKLYCGELDRMGISAIEQPVAADDIETLRELTARGLCIVADESVSSQESLKRVIFGRAASMVNIRISKCGGLIAAQKRAREALAAGLQIQIGCQVGESSLLSSAQLKLLDTLPQTRYAEGCFGRYLLQDDPARPLLQFGYGGKPPPPPPGFGLGIEIDEATLERQTIRLATVDRATSFAPANSLSQHG